MIIDLRELPVFVLSLKEDRIQFERLYESLLKRGFKNICLIVGERDELSRYRGQADSYLKALKIANPPFLILEDDCEFTEFENTLELEIMDNADAVYIGNSQWAYLGGHVGYFLRYQKTEFKNLLRVYNMLCAHAILYLTREFVDEAVRVYEYAQRVQENEARVVTIPGDLGISMVMRFWKIFCLDAPIFRQGAALNRISGTNGLSDKRTTEYFKTLPRDLGKAIEYGYLFDDRIF